MDTEYVIDGAFEFGELTALELVTLCHPLGGYWAVRHAVDDNRAPVKDFLANTARHALTHAGEHRHLFALQSARHVPIGLEFLSNRANHLVQRTIQANLGVAPRGFAVAGLEGIEDAYSPVYVASPEEVTEGTVRRILNDNLGSLAQRWQEDLDALHEAASWVSNVGIRHVLRLQAGDESAQAVATVVKSLAVEDMALAVARKRQAQERAARRHRRALSQRAKAAIKKATKLFEGLGQRETLNMFISGQEVVMSHPDSMFKFALVPLRETGWLVDRTMEGRSHTPYELQLLTKTDVHVARLCVYFSSSPVLDQLLAVLMHVTSGEENRLLETANWFAHGDIGEELRGQIFAANPKLVDKFPKERAADESRGLGPERGDWGVRLPDFVAAGEAHWEPFAGRVQQWVNTWAEPVSQKALALRDEVTSLSALMRQVDQLLERPRDQQRLLDAPAVGVTQTAIAA